MSGIRLGGPILKVDTIQEDTVGHGVSIPGLTPTSFTVVTKTADYTVTSTDYMMLGNGAGGGFNFTLPTAVGIVGRVYVFKKTDTSANGINVQTTGGQTIDGSATRSLTVANQSLMVISDNVNWNVIAPSAIAPRVVALTDATTIISDASLLDEGYVTLAGNRTLANPTNPTNGQRILYRIKQDATGSRTLTLDTAFRLGTTISSSTLTTTASKTDYLEFIYNATDGKWDIINFVKGY